MSRYFGRRRNKFHSGQYKCTKGQQPPYNHDPSPGRIRKASSQDPQGGSGRQAEWTDIVNTTGSHALAKAGCGDILTGIIGGLAAQGVDPFAAAVLGAYLHGLSAEILVKKRAAFSVTASDVAEGLGKIPELM